MTRVNQGLFSTTMEAEKRDPGNEVGTDLRYIDGAVRINRAVFSRKSFSSQSSLVVSGVITLYRVFEKMFKLRKVQYTII